MSQLESPSNSASGSAATEANWFLFGAIAPGESLIRIAINKDRFVLGRRPGMDLTLLSQRVSGRHAEIVVAGELLFIRDLGSKNGTFVNRRRVTDMTPIGEGDHIELADIEFRVEYAPTSMPAFNQRGSYSETCGEIDALEGAWVLTQLDELIDRHCVIPHYQQIVAVFNNSTVGYEALARSPVVGLENPYTMFETARLANREVELSLVCRERAVQLGRALPAGSRIFLNTHPAECLQVDVLPSLRKLRNLAADHELVVEVHEAAIDDLKVVRRFIDELAELNIAIAYDDFGAGRSRLVELIQAPPDFLKFDRSLIAEIDMAPDKQRKMLKILVDMVHDMGTFALAEGIETRAEAECCRDLGFNFVQGYFYGKPAPVEDFKNALSNRERLRLMNESLAVQFRRAHPTLAE
jgi:EAL domain-containing protein (putative c-di-GMP-specific phosphodiesterase class I)